MPHHRRLRVVALSLVQLAAVTVAAFGVYDRGPVARLAGRLTGSDPHREAVQCAAALAAVAAQRIPANAVLGPDGRVRYAIVRTAPDCVARRSLPGQVERLAWLIVLVLSGVGPLRRAISAVRRRGEDSEDWPPSQPLPRTEPYTASRTRRAYALRLRR